VSRLRTAVLGVLVAVLTSAGVGAPDPAQAAGAYLGWVTYENPVARWEQALVCTSDDSQPLVDGRTVVIQIMEKGVWVTKNQITVDNDGQCVRVFPGYLSSSAGLHFFRALYRPAPDAELLSANVALDFSRVDLDVLLVDENYFSLTTTTKRTVPMLGGPFLGQSVDLQRKSGSSWVTVGHSTATADREGDLRVPVPTRAGTATYRAVVRAGGWTDQRISATFTMHQTDYAKHRDYLPKVRGYIKASCPTVPIYVDTPLVAPGSRFYGAARISTYERQPRIEIRSGMSASALKPRAQGLCADIRRLTG